MNVTYSYSFAIEEPHPVYANEYRTVLHFSYGPLQAAAAPDKESALTALASLVGNDTGTFAGCRVTLYRGSTTTDSEVLYQDS